jgi:hypothetical protein
VGASSQPRPTASYARRKTSIPLTRLPSGSTPWICPISSSVVAPYFFGSNPAAVMSSVTSRLRLRSNQLRKLISRLHNGHSPSTRTLNGHLFIHIHPIPQQSCPEPTSNESGVSAILTLPLWWFHARLSHGTLSLFRIGATARPQSGDSPMDHGLPVELDPGDGHIGPEGLPRGDHGDSGQLGGIEPGLQCGGFEPVER